MNALAFERDVFDLFLLTDQDRRLHRRNGTVLGTVVYLRLQPAAGSFEVVRACRPAELALPVARVDEHFLDVVCREAELGDLRFLGDLRLAVVVGQARVVAVHVILAVRVRRGGVLAVLGQDVAQTRERIERAAATTATDDALRHAQGIGSHAEARLAFRTLGIHPGLVLSLVVFAPAARNQPPTVACAGQGDIKPRQVSGCHDVALLQQ